MIVLKYGVTGEMLCKSKLYSQNRASLQLHTIPLLAWETYLLHTHNAAIYSIVNLVLHITCDLISYSKMRLPI